MKRFRYDWQVLFAGLLALVIASTLRYDPEAFLDTYANDTQTPIISEQRADHILYGDASGGGHRHGVGTPCKSEFPRDWDDGKIIAVTSRIAANDNADWRTETNGYHVSETMVEGVNVRVVLDKNKRDVITAYPINLPRNPCPANDP